MRMDIVYVKEEKNNNQKKQEERITMTEEKKVRFSEQENQELINAVRNYQNGDTAAFDTLYQLSCRYLYVCIWKVLGNEEESRDALQETYLDIASCIMELKQAESFLPWASVIANRKCYAHIRKNKNEVPVDTEDDIFGNLEADEEFIPENVMQDREKQRLIREIIDGLSEMQRLCVISYYYEGKKQEEIAQELDIPLNSVKSHLLRAKAKIKEEVLALEKEQGTRLYSFAPLLLLLLNEDAVQCVLPESLRETIVAKAGVTSKKSAGAAVSDAAGKAVQTRIIIGTVAAVVVLGGGGAFLFQHGNTNRQAMVGGGLPTEEATDGIFAVVQETAAEAFEGNTAESVLADKSLEEQNPEEQDLEELSQEETQTKVQDELVFEAVMNLDEFESYGKANGNVIPVKKDGLWGAINYDKEEIVPCEYMGYWSAPDDEGMFVLTNSRYDEYDIERYTYYIFNKEGKLLYESSANDDEVSTSGGMYCVTTMEEDDSDGYREILGRVSYYKADGTMIYSEPCSLSSMRPNGFRDGYVTVTADYESESEIVGKIGKLDRNGNVTWHEMYVDPKMDNTSTVQHSPQSSFNHGYCVTNNKYFEAGFMTMLSENYETFAEFNLFYYQLQGDTLVYDRRNFDEMVAVIGYPIDGAYYYNYGTKMVWEFGDREVLVDLSLYPGMTYETADGRIVQAVYDRIDMSEETYWLIMDGDKKGYIDHDGQKMQLYDDATEFCHGRALVIENGTAYLINENFEKIEEIGEAEAVGWIWDFFIIQIGGSRQLYPVDGAIASLSQNTKSVD